MPRFKNISLALATLFATAAIVSAQSAYPAGPSNSNEALQYQNQNGQKASPYDYDGSAQGGQYAAPSGQTYAAPNAQGYDGGQYAQQAPAYSNEYPQSAQTPVPAVDSGIQYPAPAVVAYPAPYPYYGYPYGYPYYGGVRIGLGFGYYGGYRGGYYPYRGGGFRGGYGGGFRGSVGGGFRGGAGFHGRR